MTKAEIRAVVDRVWADKAQREHEKKHGDRINSKDGLINLNGVTRQVMYKFISDAGKKHLAYQRYKEYLAQLMDQPDTIIHITDEEWVNTEDGWTPRSISTTKIEVDSNEEEE